MVENLPGYVEVDAETLMDKGQAVYFDFGDTKEWIPKSQMEDWPDEGEFGTVLVKEWIAIEKEII